MGRTAEVAWPCARKCVECIPDALPPFSGKSGGLFEVQRGEDKFEDQSLVSFLHKYSILGER